MPPPAPSIPSPLRILVLSPPSTPLPPLLSEPTLCLSTPYYAASIPVWHDTLPESEAELAKWEEEWRGDEAGEVLDALGAWAVVFSKAVGGVGGIGGANGEGLPRIRSFLSTISSVIKRHNASSLTAPEPLLLAVSVRQPLSPRLDFSDEQWEDICHECGGWEWIDGEKEGGERNEFKEKVGLERLKEALEANEWASSGTGTDSASELEFGDEAKFGFGLEAAEMESEVRDLKAAVHGSHEKQPSETAPERQLVGDKSERGDEGAGSDGNNTQIEELEKMMLKMQAIKDMGESMPEAERKRFAAKAVKDVMRML